MTVLEYLKRGVQQLQRPSEIARLPLETASERRGRFLREADTTFSRIPLPNGATPAVRLAEVVPGKIGLGSVTWAVKTNEKERFVFVKRWPNGDENLWVVMAKARYFYAAWVAGRDQPTGMRSDPPDFKNLLIENPWLQHNSRDPWTFENPVHLPEIGSSFSVSHNCHIAFVNGRNRTRWLISQGASVIPVMVRSEQAAYELHEMMGDSSYPPANVLKWQQRSLNE